AVSRYEQGKYDLAEKDARRALKIVEGIPNGASYVAGVNVALGQILVKTGRAREAEPLLRHALATRRRAAKRGNYTAVAAGALGECLAAEKRYAEAEPLLIESYEVFKSLHVPMSPAIKRARDRLVSLYTAWGKPAVAKMYAP